MRSLILCAFAALALTAVVADEKKVVCYVSNWSMYRQGAGQFSLDDITPNLCTHLIYSFVGIDGDNVKILDPWQDLSDGGGKDGFRRFNAKQSSGVKTLVAIGGWNDGSSRYSAMVSNPASRARFVQNVVNFVKKYNFNGFDVDWEYPAQRGGAPSDYQNYVALLKELREAFDKAGGLILSAAVGVSEATASQSYNIREMSKYLHFINIMAYDFHTANEPQTGLNAPLKAGSSDTGLAKQLNIEAAIKYWLSQGAPKEKIILGTATYGRAFTLADPSSNGVGARAIRPGNIGPYTGENGMLGYNEICEFQNREQWTVKFDEERRVPYAYHGDQWVGYDNVQSIKEKAEFIKSAGLGGAMVWSLETDDFRGICGDKFPLVNTLNQVLRNGKQVSDRAPQPPKTSSPSVTQKPSPPPSNNNNNNHNNNASGNGECTAEGNIADPTTCERYFTCLQTANGFAKFAMPCPPGLCYKASIDACDWK